MLVVRLIILCASLFYSFTCHVLILTVLRRSDAGNPRALAVGIATTGGGNALTVALCTSACKAGGYQYAGAEYAGECCMSSYATQPRNQQLTFPRRLRQLHRRH